MEYQKTKEKKKVIILGAKGMLGQELARVFSANESYEVLAWDREELDITDNVQAERKIISQKPNIIINAAAYNAVDKAEEDEKEFELAKKLNAQTPKNLAKIAKKAGAVFVQYVTDYLFDGRKGQYDEKDVPNPISNYGISKAIGEKNVQEVGGKYYLVRTSKLFGEPAQSADAKKSFFEVMLNLTKEKDELKVIDDEKSCFTYVPDLASATKKLVEGKFDFGVYHLVNENPATWLEGVSELFKIAGIKNVKVLPVSAEEFPRAAKRASSTVLLNTKFPKLRSYQAALREWLERK